MLGWYLIGSLNSASLYVICILWLLTGSRKAPDKGKSWQQESWEASGEQADNSLKLFD